MIVTKPGWVQHEDDKGKKTTLFSLSLHPDGSRLATGGLDNKVKIWNVAPMLHSEAELDPNVPKLLATMGLHNGTVMCVAFSNGTGQYLASGSDDNIVLIWECDMSNSGSFGNLGSHNVENWKAVRRLVGHESDVTDLAWSPENTYLASCGLDRKIFIWDGQTFERLRCLTAHQGFVKGLTWDPVGKYLASQADDHTLNIWKTSDWSLEAQVKEPFEDSANSTFYSRPSWSPDGSYVAAANAAEKDVPIASIIRRDRWKNEISLVGHRDPVEVVRFNPVLFWQVEPNDDGTTTKDKDDSQLTCVCAVASQDCSISIWSTCDPRAVSVTEEIFEHNIMDMDWSSDGMNLFACSFDGTIAVIQLNESEMGQPISLDKKFQLLTKHGYKQKKVVMAETPVQLQLEEEYAMASKQAAPLMSSTTTTTDPTLDTALPVPQEPALSATAELNIPPAPVPAPAEAPLSNSPTPAPQKMTITKDGRKRIQPMFLRTLTTPATPKTQPHRTYPGGEGSLLRGTPAKGPHALFSSLTNGGEHTLVNIPGITMDGPVQQVSATRTMPLEAVTTGNKRKATTPGETALPASKRNGAVGDTSIKSTNKTTNGSTDKHASGTPSTSRRNYSVVNSQVYANSQICLSVPRIQAKLTKHLARESHIILTAHNDLQGKSLSSVEYAQNTTVQWTTLVSSYVLLLTGNEWYTMVACDDGALHVFSPAGRRLFPGLVLEAPVSFMDCYESFFLCLTSVGLLYVWDLKREEAILAGVSVGPVLDLATTPAEANTSTTTIASAYVRPGGVAILITSNGQAYMYNLKMKVWMKVVDRWFSSSDYILASLTPPPTVALAQSRGVLSALQTAATRVGDLNHGDGFLSPDSLVSTFRKMDETQRKMVTMDHLEHQMVSSQHLNSPNEFRYWLCCYAKRLADENAQERVTELCNWLLGPLYYAISTGADQKPTWNATVLGFPKRGLLKEVLKILGTNRQLQRITKQYHESLENLKRQ
ncbi:HIR complex subunit [Dispira simplex]|nr:HIR complex subunit [Dispira simplex]